MFGPLADSTPKSFTDALNRPDSKLWWDALCSEIKAIIQNETRSVVDLPQGKRAIPLKWVFKIKHDAKGNFEKYKAGMVAKGYSQVAGLDFNEMFASVVRIESIQTQTLRLHVGMHMNSHPLFNYPREVKLVRSSLFIDPPIQFCLNPIILAVLL